MHPVSPRKTLWSRDTLEYVPRNFTEHDYFVTHSHLPISKTNDIDDVLWQYGDQFWRRICVGGFASLIDDLVNLIDDNGYARYSLNETVHFNLVKEAARTVVKEAARTMRTESKYLYQYMRLFLKNERVTGQALKIYAEYIVDHTRNRLKLSTIVDWWLQMNKQAWPDTNDGSGFTEPAPVAKQYRNHAAYTAALIEWLNLNGPIINGGGGGLKWLLAHPSTLMYEDDVTRDSSHHFFGFVALLKSPSFDYLTRDSRYPTRRLSGWQPAE